MKRFIETTIWTQNKWFRKLELKYKLFWFYIISHCDSVGVWEEDFELASFIIGGDFNRDDISNVFGDKVKWFNGKKLWIIDFCNFQYGTLVEENINNKPHQSYINLLKKHSLWIDYTKTIHSPKEKDKEKETDDVIEKNWKSDFEIYKSELRAEFEKLVSDKEFIKQQEKYFLDVDIKLSIERACVNFWATEAGWKKKKSARISSIDWKATLTNAIGMNKVYKSKELKPTYERL